MHITADELLNARSRFFPFWWMYIGAGTQSPPLYHVVSDRQADLDLARAVQPDVVRADYRLSNAAA